MRRFGSLSSTISRCRRSGGSRATLLADSGDAIRASCKAGGGDVGRHSGSVIWKQVPRRPSARGPTCREPPRARASL